MARSRHQREQSGHYAVLVNKRASQYSRRAVSKLLEAIKKRGSRYSIFEPDTAMALLKQAQQVAPDSGKSARTSGKTGQRGDISALIACGGDGTFNLVARAAIEADMPVGALPLGQFNNIARHLYGTADVDAAIAAILAGNYRKIDVGFAADQPFISAVGLGFVPELFQLLKGQKLPRFGFGWSQIGAKAAAGVKLTQLTIKIDAFRFEVSPILLNVNLLPYAAGIPFSPASIADDSRAEIIFDMGTKLGEFSSLTRVMLKGKYLFGNDIRMYRGQAITIQPTKGRMLYLDGELIPLPTNVLSIKVGEKQVKAYCA